MKRFLCIILSVLICASVLACAVIQTSAAGSDTLVITDEGRVIAQVKVGGTFLYRVGLFSGDLALINGEGAINYDTKAVKPIIYGNPPEKYFFCDKLHSTSSVVNFTDLPGSVRYNFSLITGVTGFDSADKPYIKLRFQALTSGTTEIRHIMETLTARNSGNTFVKLFRNGKANDSFDLIPYCVSSVENPSALIGDADDDGTVSIVDATCVQWITAGKRMTCNTANADANGDGSINLKDALAIRRYKAGMSTATDVGGWRFASD